MVELLLSEVHSGFADIVGLALLEFVVQLVDGCVETCSPDLARIIHERHVEKFALATLVRPSPDVRFLSDTGSDGPIVLIGAKSLDGIDNWCLSATILLTWLRLYGRRYGRGSRSSGR